MKPTIEPDKPVESSGQSELKENETNKDTIKDVNKLVYRGNVTSKLDRAKQPAKRDEIPLIDDGVEETGDRNEESSTQSSSQTRSNGEEMREHRENSQRTDQLIEQIDQQTEADQRTDRSTTGLASQSDRPSSNTTVTSDTPSIPPDQPAAGLDQSHSQMISNFQNINLNDDGANEPHDLCQCECFLIYWNNMVWVY